MLLSSDTGQRAAKACPARRSMIQQSPLGMVTSAWQASSAAAAAQGSRHTPACGCAALIMALDWCSRQLSTWRGVNAGTCAVIYKHYVPHLNCACKETAAIVSCWPLVAAVRPLLQSCLADELHTVEFHNRQHDASNPVVKTVKALLKFRRSACAGKRARPRASPPPCSEGYSFRGRMEWLTMGMVCHYHREFTADWEAVAAVRARMPRAMFARHFCDALMRRAKSKLAFRRVSSEPRIAQRLPLKNRPFWIERGARSRSVGLVVF